jgi:uncharacterized protein YhaN
MADPTIDEIKQRLHWYTVRASDDIQYLLGEVERLTADRDTLKAKVEELGASLGQAQAGYLDMVDCANRHIRERDNATAAVKVLAEALATIKAEANRKGSNAVHLHRCAAVQANTALADPRVTAIVGEVG